MVTKTPTTDYDASEFLGNSAHQAELIDDALKSNNAAYIAHAIGVVAKARGMSEIARRTGINRQTLYGALGESGNPTIETFFSVIQALGLVLRAEAQAEEAWEELRGKAGAGEKVAAEA